MSVPCEIEVAVVGAGPAGAAAAIALAESGREVVLIDQHEFPRDKPCGDALSPAAVRYLIDNGLESFVAGFPAIEGIRFSNDSRFDSEDVRLFGKSSMPPPRCIPRRELDAALLGAAIERGAKFMLGRVEGVAETVRRSDSLQIRGSNGSLERVSARVVIGADGATSRIRREVGAGPALFGERAFALRQYVKLDASIDPVLEIWRPLRFRDIELPGYGWVFPVADRLANVGVGFYRGHRSARWADSSLADVLAEFLVRLGSRRGWAFDGSESIADPVGAPVAVGFDPHNVEFDSVLLAGDAARMTDPYIGEGIAEALRGGTIAAEHAIAILDDRERPRYGGEIAREFPRLGSDVGVLLRASGEELPELPMPSSAQFDAPAGVLPVGESFGRLMFAASEPFDFGRTPVARQLEACNDRTAGWMLAFETLAKERIQSEFPFATEHILRRMSASSGPTLAATLASVQIAFGASPSHAVASMALSIELLDAAIETIAFDTREARSNSSEIEDGFATLIADHALSTGLMLATSLGAVETARLAQVAQAAIEGVAIDCDDEWDMTRPEDRYLRSIELRHAGLHEFAATVGARHAGRSSDVSLFAEFGRDLGLALGVANDVVDLLGDRDSMFQPPGTRLRRGCMTLPVIYALREDSNIEALLTPESINGSFDRVVQMVRGTDAVERCALICEEAFTSCISKLEVANLRDSALHKLAQLPLDRLSHVR